jgi:ATP-binding cassette, subfamily B, bacterial
MRPPIPQGRSSTLANVRLALHLVWRTSPSLGIAFLILTVVAGVLPSAIAYVAALIVDAVVTGVRTVEPSSATVRNALLLVALECLLVAAVATAQRTMRACEMLMRAQLAQAVNELIFDKALTLDLDQFENPALYDKLSQVHRGASHRPLSLVTRLSGLAQHSLSLLGFAVLLIQFSPWAFALLMAASLPVFLSETRFSGEAFRMFIWRSPEGRLQTYLSTMLVREDYAKEMQLFGLGRLFAQRHRDIYRKLYAEDRSLAIRRCCWAVALGLLATVTWYGACGWIVISALTATITIGQMTMYLVLFRQGQGALAALLTCLNGVYEDQLYIATLRDYLDTPSRRRTAGATRGPQPGDGIRFENVSYSYPGASAPALVDINLHIPPHACLGLVGVNGSGKTTLIKLLTRLYTPTTGRILLDGLDLLEWDETALRERIGVIFQDFRRYHLTLGENIGAGDVHHFDDEARWHAAAEKAQLETLIEKLPHGYRTQLGTWFAEGRELSGGQWQKVALARAFVRTQADILVLDEPTAAIDASAEAALFERFRDLTQNRTSILISHRFAAVRRADQIVVLSNGRIIERGAHEELMQTRGRYSELFSIQAAGYR